MTTIEEARQTCRTVRAALGKMDSKPRRLTRKADALTIALVRYRSHAVTLEQVLDAARAVQREMEG